jgi:hypothetical protein
MWKIIVIKYPDGIDIPFQYLVSHLVYNNSDIGRK